MLYNLHRYIRENQFVVGDPVCVSAEVGEWTGSKYECRHTVRWRAWRDPRCSGEFERQRRPLTGKCGILLRLSARHDLRFKPGFRALLCTWGRSWNCKRLRLEVPRHAGAQVVR